MTTKKDALPGDYALGIIDKNPRFNYDTRITDVDGRLTLDLFERLPFHVPLVKFLSASTGIFGTTGSGKTMSVARIIEQITKHKIPYTIFDKEGSFDTLPEWDSRIKVYYFIEDEEENLSYKIKTFFGGLPQFSPEKPLDEAETRKLAKDNFFKGEMSVFVLSGINDRVAKTKFVYDYTNTLYSFCNKLYFSNMEASSDTDRVVIQHLLLLDECHYFLAPSFSDHYDKDVSYGKEVKNSLGKIRVEKVKILNKVKNIYSTIGAEGRKRGITLVLASQQIIDVPNTVLNNLNQLFLLRTGSRNEIERYGHYMRTSDLPMSEAMKNTLPVFSAGEMIYLFKGHAEITRMKERESYHKDKTPSPSQSSRTIKKIRDGKIDVAKLLGDDK